MAGKKSEKVVKPEVVPGAAESPMEDVPGAAESPMEDVPGAAESPMEDVPGAAESPMEDVPGAAESPAEDVPGAVETPDIFSDECLLEENSPQENQAADEEGSPETESREAVQEDRLFKITCKNGVSETIGGVMFVAGVGYTRDAYTASWFRNKAGYSVEQKGM